MYASKSTRSKMCRFPLKMNGTFLSAINARMKRERESERRGGLKGRPSCWRWAGTARIRSPRIAVICRARKARRRQPRLTNRESVTRKTRNERVALCARSHSIPQRGQVEELQVFLLEN